MQRTIVAGNFKMHKTAAQTRDYVRAFLAHTFPTGVEIVLVPPFTALPAASDALADSRVRLGAQTMHWELEGPFTGEVSAPMLLELGVSYVLLGHSERRAYCGETDGTVNRKVATALAQGLTPIVAVGETGEEREAGHTDRRVVAQTRDALAGVRVSDLGRLALAYEPIWAIGTGRNCDPVEANRVMTAIRECMPGLDETPILYGGSMKTDNVAAYLAQPNVNGGLVGGACLDPAGFAALIANAA